METQGPAGRVRSPRSGKKAALGNLCVLRKPHRLAREEEGREKTNESKPEGSIAAAAQATSVTTEKQPTASIRPMMSLFPLADQKQGAADRLSAAAALQNIPLTAFAGASVPIN